MVPVLVRPSLLSTLTFINSNRFHQCHSRQHNHRRFTTSLFADATKLSVPKPSFHIHTSFRDLVDQYDAFILDQFGVLHNGVHALEGAIELVHYMYEQKKRLIILSNTSAPSKNALERLQQLGFDPSYFVDAVTSGEEASRYVQMTHGSTATEKITKVIFLTWDVRIPNNPRLTAPPQAFLDACCGPDHHHHHHPRTIQVTEDIADADLVLLHGSEVWYRGDSVDAISLGSYIETGDCTGLVDTLLEQFRQYNLPMVCANPDVIVITPTNGKAYMPGRIAQRYVDMGGTCHVFGKPNVEHFDACIRQLQQLTKEHENDHESDKMSTIPKHRVAHVGDSLYHDVVGANNANIPSIFITSGVHASQLTDPTSGMLRNDLQALYELFEAEESIYPTHVVPAFRL
jgi:ribonucleotide monophosphatase NagD (HAD superfamily)